MEGRAGSMQLSCGMWQGGQTYRVVKGGPKQSVVSNLMRNEQHVVPSRDKHAKERELHISGRACHQGMSLHVVYRYQFEIILLRQLMCFPHTNLHLQDT